VQSSIGRISVLPARPVEWKSGCIEGIACRGQVLVERLRWAPGSVTAILRSPKEVSLEIVLPARPKALRIDGNLVEGGNLATGERVLLSWSLGSRGRSRPSIDL